MGDFLAPRPRRGNWLNHHNGLRGSFGLGLSLIAASLPGTAVAEERALALDTTLIVDGMIATGADGGHSGATTKLDAKLIFDGTPLGIAGLSGMANVAVYSGEGLSGSLGDLQGVSNIAATRMMRPVNAWLQYGSGPVAVKAGIIDTNADFDEQNVGAPFINASFGMGPEFASSGFNGGGAAPYSALGVIGFVTDDARGLKLRAGIFTGQTGDPDRPRRLYWPLSGVGNFSAAEADWTGERLRIALGGWHHSGRMPRIDGTGDHAGSTGGFALVEGTLAGQTADPATGDARGARLDGWVRLGLADGATAAITRYAGGGLVAAGFWDKHPADTLGLAVAHARTNRAAGPDTVPETAIELTYQHGLFPGLTLQPDVQWLLNPGADRTRGDALVFGLRLIAVH